MDEFLSDSDLGALVMGFHRKKRNCDIKKSSPACGSQRALQRNDIKNRVSDFSRQEELISKSWGCINSEFDGLFN